MKSDGIVIGGGPAGMFAAITAAEQGKKVLLLEKNHRLGKKLLITGKGRCNVTNHCTGQEVLQNTPRNGRFLFSAMAAFPPEKTYAFFESHGCPLKVERGNRVFPVSDCAQSVLDCLQNELRRLHVTVSEERVTEIHTAEGRVTGVRTDRGSHEAGWVILATGGVSYPATGSTGDGYRMAEALGHTIVPQEGSLVPLEAEEDCKQMQGLSLRNCGLMVEDTHSGGTLYRDFGELLFTHFGVSGPVILSASAHMRQMQPGRYRLHLDLKPALSPEQLDARLVRDFKEHANTDFSNALGGLLPRKMIPVAVERSGIAGSQKCREITREQRHRLGELLRDFSLTVTGFRPVEEAVVTAGGVCTREIDARTMQSKRVSGLYFAGEVLDVDGYTGGFNLQIAFSTGAAAGNHI